MIDVETSLTLVRKIKASPQTVFDALVKPDQIALWWSPDPGPVLATEVDPHVGGRFRLRFRMLDGIEHESVGTYREFDPPKRLVMTWRWLTHADDTGESLIEIDLKPIATGTEMTFVHARLRDRAVVDSHRAGWTGAFDKLVAMFERN